MQAAALRPALLTAFAVCATLAACRGSGKDDVSAQGSEVPASGLTIVGGAPDSPAPLPTTPVPCSTQIGSAAAAALVKQCITLSPATRPPCNAQNSCAMIEGEIARSCAIAGDDAADKLECGPKPHSGAAAKAAIERYYSALNARDFPTAWQVWGPDGAPRQTYEQFLKGYARTRQANVTVGTPGPVEGAAGSVYISVPVTVDAQLTNGRKQRFIGSYMLRQRNIETSQGWHITSANLKPD